MNLSASGLVKRYPGVLALDEVSIDIRGGEVHAVAGENGAGKSTLMHILAGATIPDGGTLTVDGTPVRFRSPRDAQALGIRMIHQELNLVPDMSVAENVLLGAEPSRAGVVDRARLAARTREVLDRLGQHALPTDVPVGRLSLAARQMTEIAKAVAANARVVIMDEPTAILAHDETEALFTVIDQLRAAGVAIVYVSHRLDDMARLADRVTVLRDGRVVDSRPAAELSSDDIVRLMIGRELAAGYPASQGQPGDVRLELEHVSSGPVTDASLTLRSGEILGVVGLVGSGRTELARAIAGAAPLTSGTMRLDGKPFTPRSPRDAIDAGVALLPEDRKRQGLVLIAAIRDNVSIASLDSLAMVGVIDRGREAESVSQWTTALRVRTPSIATLAGQLSGGNQQKVVLARWMLSNARIILFDEPTRGIDVGAKAEIYALMRKLADEGAALLVISSDLPEALGMADRVVVMRNGRILATLPRVDATQERVAPLMLGIAS
ncbi:MAG TPA: sugar ABC transporter ATP-binding protein [Gemmatimonadaceae bacterium]